jgi:hypothetical protein
MVPKARKRYVFSGMVLASWRLHISAPEKPV